MIVTEEGLEKLVHTSMDALHRMRAELDDHAPTESKTARGYREGYSASQVEM
jgi:hypothetical protein